MDRKPKIAPLAVIELPEDHKVRCQAPGCSKTIWKAVHVVRLNDALQVIGSSCFKKLYHDLPPGVGLYTGKAVRKLTEEERQKLLANTEALIKQLEHEFQEAQQARQAAKSLVEAQQPGPDVARPAKTEPPGPARTVTCFYCKKPMMTHLAFTPGMGFKCDTCKKNKVPLPRSRWSAPTRPTRPQKTIEQLAKDKAADDYRKAKGK